MFASMCVRVYIMCCLKVDICCWMIFRQIHTYTQMHKHRMAVLRFCKAWRSPLGNSERVRYKPCRPSGSHSIHCRHGRWHTCAHTMSPPILWDCTPIGSSSILARRNVGDNERKDDWKFRLDNIGNFTSVQRSSMDDN